MAGLLDAGPRRSGKTTIQKQLQIFFGEGFPGSDRLSYAVLVHRNVMTAVHQLLRSMKDLEIPFESDLPERSVEILSESDVGVNITPELGAMITAVWRDNGTQTCYSRRREFNLPDSTK